MKLKTAIIGLTGCFGCQVQFLNLEDELLDLLEVLDIVHFPLAKEENSDGPFDLALIEGSVSTSEQVKEVKEMREKSKKVVALGTCACFGNLQGISNFQSKEEVRRTVYGDAKLNYEAIDVAPIDRYIQVDHYVPGCPYDKGILIETLKYIALGKRPLRVDYCVCAECKLRENGCLLIEKGQPCMGPITRGGCGALCPSYNYTCEGCQGPSEDAAEVIDAYVKILKDKGISEDDILLKLRKFAPLYKPFLLKILKGSGPPKEVSKWKSR